MTPSMDSVQRRVAVRGIVWLVLLVSLTNDLTYYLDDIGREQSSSSVWASWIGEVPTAAELYGEAANELPSTEAFNDDDDEDEELDASASNEYPESDSDEAYEDADGK